MNRVLTERSSEFVKHDLSQLPHGLHSSYFTVQAFSKQLLRLQHFGKQDFLHDVMIVDWVPKPQVTEQFVLNTDVSISSSFNVVVGFVVVDDGFSESCMHLRKVSLLFYEKYHYTI